MKYHELPPQIRGWLLAHLTILQAIVMLPQETAAKEAAEREIKNLQAYIAADVVPPETAA